MDTLNIDIETYSDEDIKNGVYKYVDSPNFEILLFAFSFNGEEPICLDLTKEEIPEDLIKMLQNPRIYKIAYNAQFERVCLAKYLGIKIDPKSWRCTMVHAAQLGLPAGLGRCAAYLNLEQQKDTAGTNLIKYFSMPCKPTKVNGGRTRNYPDHDPEKWQLFIDYCIQDVKTEMAIADKIGAFPVFPREWDYYAIDQAINDRGVGVDMDLVHAAIELKDEKSESLMAALKESTGLDNPNSRAQLLPWLQERGYGAEGLTKDDVKEALKTATGELAEVLKLKVESSLSSLKKYEAIERVVCADGRVHGLLQFYGANRTGRWAGRLVQVQNLARNYLSDLDDARNFVLDKDVEAIEILYDSLNDTLKQLIRTSFVAKKDHDLYVSDFSAIEARVIAWYAKEMWRIEVFKTHGKIYEASASQMFKIPLESVDKEMRQRGKVSELALGYQGGAGALIQMGALEMGVKEEELQNLVDSWRRSNSNIVKFWKSVNDAATKAIKYKTHTMLGRLLFKFEKGFLRIKLPSGRHLSYPKAKLEAGKYGDQIVYEGQGDKAYFSKQHTYGGKLVENIVQATARDLLAEALVRLEEEGYSVVFHVHDEAVIEAKTADIDTINALMAEAPEWADGLPLNSDGYVTHYYMKD